MYTPFLAYYQHMAKLAQVANKQTMFLTYMLSEMEYDGDGQYTVDMSTAKKIKIMAEVSPDVPHDKALGNANQYLHKIKKAGLIKNIGNGLWLVDPMNYSQRQFISKGLREKNNRIYQTYEYGTDKLNNTTTELVEDGEKGDAG